MSQFTPPPPPHTHTLTVPIFIGPSTTKSDDLLSYHKLVFCCRLFNSACNTKFKRCLKFQINCFLKLLFSLFCLAGGLKCGQLNEGCYSWTETWEQEYVSFNEQRDVALWCDGSTDRSFMVDLLSYFLFQPVLHAWCNKDSGMYYPVGLCM